MKPIIWTESLSVGIDLIDEQHKTWISHYNKAAETLTTHHHPEQIIKTLEFLVDYTGTHFATEEKHMKANNYPHMAEHFSRHQELRETLSNLVTDFEEEGTTDDLSDYINTFLNNWLIEHIKTIDTKFASWAKENGVSIVDA
ncbi:bacteriohemerythrin [Myxococcota bacterium]|nr:bacteriohemerythrin [Myxococcota bacterium]MBU1535490.1 bacteriohemerythrin [Myxococcota bacterium]